MDLCERLRGQGLAIPMATHDIFRALDVATHVGIMVGGLLARKIHTQQVEPAELEALYLDIVRAHEAKVN